MMSDDDLFTVVDADKLLDMVEPLPDDVQKQVAYLVGYAVGNAYNLGRQHAYSEMASVAGLS